MVGWYVSEKKVAKPNMETLKSYYGEVVLYKRLMTGTGTPYALYKGNQLIANISEYRLAVQEYNATVAKETVRAKVAFG